VPACKLAKERHVRLSARVIAVPVRRQHRRTDPAVHVSYLMDVDASRHFRHLSGGFLSFSPNGECQIRAEKESEPAAPGTALVLLVLT